MTTLLAAAPNQVTLPLDWIQLLAAVVIGLVGIGFLLYAAYCRGGIDGMDFANKIWEAKVDQLQAAKEALEARLRLTTPDIELTQESTPMTTTVKLSADEVCEAIAEYVKNKVDGSDNADAGDVVIKVIPDTGTAADAFPVKKGHVLAEIEYEV